jgi:PAS domain S-box-containing protein
MFQLAVKKPGSSSGFKFNIYRCSMSWITVTRSMVASACLTLAMMHLTIWFRLTDQRAHLLMSIAAISAAAIAVLELLLMRAQTTQEFGTLLKWAHLPVFFVIVSMVGFVQLYFRTGRPWLAYTVCGLRLLALVINFLSVPNLNYKEINGLQHLPIWGGETISVAKGVPNPWVPLGQLSLLAMLIFVVDASATLWSRGGRIERRRALVVGGSITFCILVSAVHSALLNFGLIRSPYIISFAFLAIVAAMGYELGSDMSRAAQLVRQLQASEAALRESEARFRMMADTAPVMVWMSGTDTLCNFFNKPWLEFTGHTLKQELGNGWSEGVYAEDLQGCLETYVSSFKGRQPFTMEYRLRRADGEYRWVLDHGVPRYTSEGEFAGYIGSCIDITDRRRAEAALRESEQQMALAADAAELAMWMWDIPRDDVWTTERGRTLFGFAQSGKINLKRFLDALHPGDRERVRLTVATALSGAGEYESEFRVVSAGQTRWITARGRTEFDGGKAVRMSGVSLDITLRKQAEERFHLVVEAVPNVIIMINAEGKIELANAQVEAVFGYTRNELIGHPVEMLVPERFRSKHPYYRSLYLDDPKPRVMGAGRELFGRRKDGSEVPVEIGLNPIHASEGLFVLASIIDITQRKQAELEAARHRNELAHLSRVTLLGELFSSVVHELTQPLTAILSNAQAAQRFLARNRTDTGELEEILRDVVAEDKHAVEVIRRLRALLKRGEVQLVLLDMNELVNSVLKLMRSDLANQDIAVQAELAPDLPAVNGDDIQLQQVLLNLIINGCDAMAGVEPSERKLLMRTELVDGKDVRVSVVDQGCGIPPEKIEDIFQPFFTTKAQGMGMGLAVCRTIITAHGGRLWATNNSKRGAAVQFTLPASVNSTA